MRTRKRAGNGTHSERLRRSSGLEEKLSIGTGPQQNDSFHGDWISLRVASRNSRGDSRVVQTGAGQGCCEKLREHTLKLREAGRYTLESHAPQTDGEHNVRRLWGKEEVRVRSTAHLKLLIEFELFKMSSYYVLYVTYGEAEADEMVLTLVYKIKPKESIHRMLSPSLPAFVWALVSSLVSFHRST